MNLRTWTLSGDALPTRLLRAAREDAFTLPGADALAAFADLLGAPQEDAPEPARQSAPFDAAQEQLNLQLAAQRKVDAGGVKSGRSKLVKQRGKTVIVVRVDNRHPVFVEVKLLHQIEAGETGADDKEALTGRIAVSHIFVVVCHIAVIVCHNGILRNGKSVAAYLFNTPTFFLLSITEN